jgi:hypothetical protein
VSLSNQLPRKPYFTFLFGGIGVCVFIYALFPLSFFSLLFLFIGFVFPASFISPEIQAMSRHRRYRFSSLKFLVNFNEFFLKNKFISRSIAPHCFSFFLSTALRLFVHEGNLFFWFCGILIYETLGRLVSFKDGDFAELFKDQRADLKIEPEKQIAESDL